MFFDYVVVLQVSLRGYVFMTKIFTAMLFTNLFFATVVFAMNDNMVNGTYELSVPGLNQSCPNGAVLNPGTLVVDCSVTVPVKSPKPRILHFEIKDSQLLAGYDIEVPVTVPNPQDYETQAYEYNVSAANYSNNCSFAANEQLILRLEQRQPFANSPIFEWDTRLQARAFPQDPDNLSASDMKRAQNGQTLKISAASAHLTVTCTAVFKADSTLFSNN
jgi:hypothetical protein